jgi:hypothetical protein
MMRSTGVRLGFGGHGRRRDDFIVKYGPMIVGVRFYFGLELNGPIDFLTEL